MKIGKLFCIFIALTFLSEVHANDDLSFRQKILMPGPLIQGHTELETQCEVCHSAFDKSDMTNLCIDCHEDIASDRTTNTGLHGMTGHAAEDDCQLCHKDHKGTNADITSLQESTFDHRLTRFPLVGEHKNLNCDSCHKEEYEKYRDAPTACIDCHKNDDIHSGGTGDQCETCHQETSWQSLKPFDHDMTNFSLLGAHQGVSCNNCHVAQKFLFEETSCISCHQSADIHAGAHGTQCNDCHNEKSWDAVLFDHDKTNFPLRDQHKEIPCHACHKPNEDPEAAPTECHACHSKNDTHLGRNGLQCDNCHTTKAWDSITFDHNHDTDFLLSGKHKDVSCTQCHIGALEDPLARDCASCHKADDVHNIPEMKMCGLCHSTEGWKSVSLFDHDFTTFPLIGIHRIVPCESCHIGNQFADTNPQCFSCHETDDIHKQAMGKQCEQCHNPNAWSLWNFDHNIQTDFKLDGKHENLACDSCHLPNTDAEDTPQVCGSCHQSQDIHNGEFGLQCERCHSTSGFFELFIR